MLEMSAAKSPALAMTGAVAAAVPAPVSADGAQIVDFSAVLAGATLANDAPTLMGDMLVQPEADTPLTPELLPPPAMLHGKSGNSGNTNGKNLPVGKPSAARLTATAEKSQGKPLAQSELQEDSADIAVEQDAGLIAGLIVPATADAAGIEPAPTTSAPAPQTGIATPDQIVVTSQVTETETAATPQQTLTKLQVRPQPQPQPHNTASKTSSVDAGPSGAKPQDAPTDTVSASKAAKQPRHETARANPPSASAVALGSMPAAPSIDKAASAKTIASSVIHTSPINVAPPAPTMRAVGSRDAITLSTVAPATGAVAILATPPIVVTQPTPLRQDAGFVVTPKETSEPLRASIASLLMQAAPSSPVPTAAAATGVPIVEPTADNAPATPRKAAIVGATLPAAAMPIIKAGTASTLATSASASGFDTAPIAASEPVRQAIETATIAAPAQLAQAPAISTTPVQAAPTMTAAPYLGTPSLQVPAPHDISVTLAAAPHPARIEAAMMPTALATSDRDKTANAANASAPVVAVDAAISMARNDMDASALAAGFRSAPAPTTAASTASNPPTTPTQDIAALVDRITEARAAATPNTIRASLMHEDFGAVTLNLRNEASHLHVTLGSADPGFAPAVQAAAAASLAGNNRDEANARRETPMPQEFTPTTDTSARNDTSSQQQAGRDRAASPERASTRDATGRQPAAATERDPAASAPRRRGGVYA